MGENILCIAKLVTLHSDLVMCKPITVSSVNFVHICVVNCFGHITESGL
jgi:hypothetical protein